MANPKRSQREDVSCRAMTELIADYLNNRLSSRIRRAFEEHLKICPDCVSFLNTYRKTAELSANVEVEEMPDAVRANVLAFLRRKLQRIALSVASLITHFTG